ncbi:MAG TPA: hypothetical protein VND15_02765 [Candidatus Acidoferrales bacterium]|nr:hypothetical protein [Candidatus Acidoferrales bacterium]
MDNRKPAREREPTTDDSLSQRLKMLRAMSREDIAKVIARERDERGMQQPSDAVLQNKVSQLKRAISPEDYKTLIHSSDSKVISQMLHISRGQVNNLRTGLVSFGLVDANTPGRMKTEIGGGRKSAGVPAFKRRSKEEIAAVMETLRAKVVEKGPITYERLGKSTGYDVGEIRGYVNRYFMDLGVRKFDFDRGLSGKRTSSFNELLNGNPHTVYLIDDMDPESIRRFKRLVAKKCNCDTGNINARTSLGHLLANLKTVLPGAAAAIEEVKEELKLRRGMVNA